MSLLKRVRSPEVPEPPPGSFSQCLVAGELIFVSGQIARDADGRIEGDGSMLSQATIALGKIKALLEAAGASMDDVARLNVYVTDITKRVEIGEARRKFFDGDFPASTLVQVAALVEPGLLVEIEATAIHRRG
ncbi:MAG: RidA family protein [Candidatus Lustribacter sp.]|jgi:enamine deaminase RidA (YjgF/YER057c/UK114 family)